jgi:hypothetical protein
VGVSDNIAQAKRLNERLLNDLMKIISLAEPSKRNQKEIAIMPIAKIHMNLKEVQRTIHRHTGMILDFIQEIKLAPLSEFQYTQLNFIRDTAEVLRMHFRIIFLIQMHPLTPLKKALGYCW